MPSLRIDDAEALRRAYEEEGLSIAAIAERAGCSPAAARRALLAAGVHPGRSGRQAGPSPTSSASSVLDDRAFLEHAYVTEGRSARRIAEEVGSTKDAVLMALRSHGIPVRTRARVEGPSPEAGRTTQPARRHSGASLWGATAAAGAPAATAPTPGRVPGDGDASLADLERQPPSHGSQDRPSAVGGSESATSEGAQAYGPVFAPRDGRRQETPPPPTRGNASWSQPAASVRPGAVELDPQEIETKAFPIVRRGYDRDEVDAFVRTVARQHREVLERARRAVESAQQAAKEAAAQREAAEQAAAQALAAPPPESVFDHVGGRVAAVLNSAAEAAEGIKAKAEDEAAEILQRAYDDTEPVRRDAAHQLAEAQRMRTEAEEEAARMLASARSEGAAAVAAARERAAEVEYDAQQRAATLERTARANVEALLAEARREYEHLRTVQQQCIDRLASVEFLAKHARDGLSESFLQPFDERLERTS